MAARAERYCVVGATLREESRVSYTLQVNTGLRRRALEQIGVLATGVTRLALILVGLLGILLGEQVIPLARRMATRPAEAVAYLRTDCAEHVLGRLPGGKKSA